MPSDKTTLFVLLLGAVVLGAYAFALRRRVMSIKRAFNDQMHKNKEIENFLSIFSNSIKTVDEIENSLNLTARYVSDLVGVSSLCIFTLEEDNHLKAAGISGAFPPLQKSTGYVLTKPKYILESLRREKIKVGEGIIGEIALTKEPLYIPDAQKDQRIRELDTAIKIEGIVAAPMLKDGKVTGVICGVNNRRDGIQISPEQFATLKFIASQVVLAQDIVRIYSDLSRQQRIKQEIDFAKQIQNSLLPHEFPENESFSTHAFTKPAKEVSGDFYDFVSIDQHRTLIVVGDACGKGIPACMLMAMARSFIRASAERFANLNDLLKELSRNLYRDIADERFVTLACCLVDTRERTVELARAGHTEFFVHVPAHKLRKICPEGSALGIFPPDIAGEFDSIQFFFQGEMNILLFTDGITEALDASEQEYGIERLSRTFTSSCESMMAPTQTIESIIRSVDAFTGSTPQSDDQTLVSIKFK